MAKRFRNAVGPAIRRRRDELGITQDDLAARLGRAGLHRFDRVTIAKIEGQLRSVFDFELPVIARILKVDIGDLFSSRKRLEDDLPDLIEGKR